VIRALVGFLLLAFLPSCVPLSAFAGAGAGSMMQTPPTTVAPSTSSAEVLKLAELRLNAVMRALDKLDKRGMLTDTRTRKLLATLIEQANDALQAASDALLIGPITSMPSLVAAADDAVAALVSFWLRERGKT